MGVYDQAARYATLDEPQAVIAQVARIAGLSLRFHQWEESRTTPVPGERDRTADKVAVLHDAAAPERPWLLLAEFQAQHDADKLDVTLTEAARLRFAVRHGEDRRGRYRVLTALVYLRGACPDESLDMTTPSGLGTRHAPVIWNVADDRADATLDELAAGQTTWGILFWVPLMAGGGDALIIERWKELAGALPEARQRADLARIVPFFAELANCLPAWQKALEEWKMTESPLMNSWIEKAQQDAKLEQAREDLIQVLNIRFPNQISKEVLETIHQQPSLTMLHDWFRSAVGMASLADFLGILRQ